MKSFTKKPHPVNIVATFNPDSETFNVIATFNPDIIKSETFSDEAINAVTLSVEIATKYAHNIIDVEHIMLALLEYKNSVVQQILVNMGVNLKVIQDETGNIIKKIKTPNKMDGVEFHISDRVKHLIDRAASEAFSLKDKKLLPEHIFLAIFDDKNTAPAKKILLAHNIEKINVYRQLKKAKSKNKKNANRLRIFLCHSSGDKQSVNELYKELQQSNVDTWLDTEKLLPGQDWETEISKAVKKADIVIVCLSKKSVNKSGYIQKEIKYALNVADGKPEGAIFIIPLKLERCTIPARLEKWQWLNYYEDNANSKLISALRIRAKQLGKKIDIDLFSIF